MKSEKTQVNPKEYPCLRENKHDKDVAIFISPSYCIIIHSSHKDRVGNPAQFQPSDQTDWIPFNGTITLSNS